MATQFVQLVGEARFYKQTIVNDTISSADWDVSGDGIILAQIAHNSTEATVLVTATLVGEYLLACTIVTAGGQTLIGETRIRVVETNV